MEDQNDRMSYSFGMKLNLGNYQTLDFHLSLSSDVKEDETEDECFARVKKYVQDKADEEYEKFEKMKA